MGPDCVWEAVSAFPGLKGAPRDWDTYSANVLTNSMQMEQSRYDGCLFYRFETSREQVEEKAGRHIDDFLVTGPAPNVEHFLAQAKDKLNMQDAVRLYRTGDEGRLFAMNLRKLEKGYALQDKPFLIHEIVTTLEMKNTKTSLIPEPISEKPQDDHDQPLTPSDAQTFKTCVGKAIYLSHHRPDIQHSVNTLSRSMRNPTMIAMRRLKKLTRSLLGTSDVCQEFCPDPHAEILQVPVDSDWADDKDTRQSCSGGAVLFHGCEVPTLGTNAKDTSSFERRIRAVRHRLRSHRRPWRSTTFASMAVQNSAAALDRLTEGACSVQTQMARQNETHRAEDARSARMAKNGTTSSSQSIDSR